MSKSNDNISLHSDHDAVEEKIFRDCLCNVPDLIAYNEAKLSLHNIENDENNQLPEAEILKFNGVLMFADVSGFTALTESYTLDGEKGVDALTIELNTYMGKIAEQILNSGGDILKYAGDAFLAVWKVERRSDLPRALNVAAKAALNIQDTCDRYITDKGIMLRVKLALSAGNIFVSLCKSLSEDERYGEQYEKMREEFNNPSNNDSQGGGYFWGLKIGQHNDIVLQSF